MLEKNAFRDAMSNLPTGVNIVTSVGPFGSAACTVSSFCSVSDVPPTILVCINRSSKSNQVIKDNGSLCVSILAENQSSIAVYCANHQSSVQERLASFDKEVMVTGSPAVLDSVCNLDCIVDNIVESGTHSVFFCNVISTRICESREALIYYRRNYHRILGVFLPNM